MSLVPNKYRKNPYQSLENIEIVKTLVEHQIGYL